MKGWPVWAAEPTGTTSPDQTQASAFSKHRARGGQCTAPNQPLARLNTLEQLRNGTLQGAQRLTLSADLREFPPEIYTLADTLEILDLSGNELAELPADLPRLHRLRILFCSGNRFTRLPEVLGRCEQLEMVGFKGNQIRELPAAALPPRLRWLILTDNQLEALPDELGRCSRLEKLALAGNRLRELPASLAQCRQLALIRLAANQLQTLPDALFELPRLAWLAVGGNPFSLAHEQRVGEHTPLPTVDWAALTLERLLGQGASGQIHAVRRADGQAAALKLFKGELTSDGLPGSELAAWMQAGQHPQLISVQARLSGHPQGSEGLLMPRVPDTWRTLAAPPSFDSCSRDVYPADLRLSAPVARGIARCIAAALAHLHAQGVAHGDLYGHNILHDGQGQALLGDFGAATLLQALPAPQAAALQQVDLRAMGWLLQELIAHSEPDPLHGAALAHWRDACLAERPGERPSAQQLADALAAPSR